MMYYKLVLYGLHCLIGLCEIIMQNYEENGNLDVDGVPLDSDYEYLSFILARFRDCQSEIKKAIFDE